MDFWTVQNINVLAAIQSQGIYLPDFNRSGYLEENPNLASLYNYVLNSMNNVNSISNGQGVIFCFYGYDQREDIILNNVERFRNFIDLNMAPIKSLWQHLMKQPNSILIHAKFKVPFFNPLLVDINDFQFLMPPVLILPPFTEDDEYNILLDISRGKFHQPSFPSNIIQGHLPYLTEANIIHYYTIT